MIPALAMVLLIGLTGWFAGPVLPRFFSIVLPYAALAIALAGFGRKILSWGTSPVPFPIATTGGQQQSLDWIRPARLEAPPGPFWAACRVALELLCFRSLLRNTWAAKTADRRIVYWPVWSLWAAALVFHYCLLIILLRHLRFFLDPVPAFIVFLGNADGAFQVGIPRLYWTGAMIMAALLFLLGRRVLHSRMRYLSLPADYFHLLLLLGIVGSGLYMRYSDKIDAVAVKAFAMGLVTFNPVNPQSVNPAFYVHLLLFCVLMASIPFSKLMHMGAILLSPTRNMPGNSRQVRHINPWNRPEPYRSYAEYEDEFREAMAGAGLPLEKALDEGETVEDAQEKTETDTVDKESEPA